VAAKKKQQQQIIHGGRPNFHNGKYTKEHDAAMEAAPRIFGTIPPSIIDIISFN
jgi:hypothetical protein